jgi:transcriptional regulator with XRE-family HTH domain
MGISNYLCPKTSPPAHITRTVFRTRGEVEMARKDAEHSGVMGDDAERLRLRMDRLGISDSELARESGVNRDTIAAIKRGQGFRRSSLAKLEAKLSELETEAGIGAPPPPDEVVEVTLDFPDGSRATFVLRGPDAEERMLRLVRRMRTNGGGASGTG